MTSLDEPSEALRRLDRHLAETHGAYSGFRTPAGPVRTDDVGLSPAAEVDRLLDRFAGSETRFLDVGCGAGQTLCHHRWVFVRRRALTRYYPVDGLPGAGRAAG
jgi:hypothetical protein